jgi:A/G-specific adenine glycosylase
MRVAGKTSKRQRRRHPPATSCPHSATLLAWYDLHRRKLPWRVAPGEAADPYRVWLSEIMLQQTTVKAVAPYFAKFLARWNDVHKLAAAPLSEVLSAWAGLGYYARARNLHACAQVVVQRHGGKFPESEDVLRELPGVGPYTAAAIAAIAYDAPATPVDGNIERVVARLFAVSAPPPQAKPELQRLARGLMPRRRAGDFAQAMMDLGATICTPKRPACALCPWMESCAGYRTGNPTPFPQRARKREGLLRRGGAFVALRDDGFVLVRTRPAKGLLGGMTEVPTSDWSVDFNEAMASDAAPRFYSPSRSGPSEWRRIATPVRHVFTHFPLELSVYWGRVPAQAPAPPGTRWVDCSKVADEALPSLMRKVVARALDAAR